MPDQKPNLKKQPPAKTAPSWWVRLQRGEWRNVLSELPQQWEKARDIIKNNYELGLRHLRLGNLNDAIMRFKLVVWLEPGHAKAWYHLGCAYLANEQLPQARKALQKSLQLKPGDEEAAYMLVMARGAATPIHELPKQIPQALAQEHFDRLAPDFTKQQLEEMQYKGHIALCQAIRASATSGRVDHVILELGVGTGLCGPLLRDIAAQITGVDMSGPMLEEAKKVQDAQGRKVYDALIRKELHAFLQETGESSYDVVMAAGVVGYLGELDAFFKDSARVLKPGGLLAFTAEKLEEGTEYRFDPASGRFLFSDDYLHALALANQLRIVTFETAQAYPHYPVWLCVFAR